MRIVTVDIARATWLFPLAELNPTGKSMTRVLVDLKERYKFKKAPTHSLDFDPEAKGLIFNEGEFVNRDGVAVLAKLSLFSDGIVSDTWSSTRDAEDLLKDAMQWVKTQHGFSLPADRSVKTLYLSALTVMAEKFQLPGMAKFEELAAMMSSRLAEAGRPNRGYIASGFNLLSAEWDQSGAPVPYRFEVRSNSHPGENRYYASAPLPTDIHLALLEDQVRLFS
jgi:hypothetical protein